MTGADPCILWKLCLLVICVYPLFRKKKHAVKNQITVNFNVEIIHKLPHSLGRKNNYEIYKIKHPVLAKGLMNLYDLWYTKVGKDFPDQISRSYKKRKGSH